jgi:hypothetical protein
VDQIQFTEAIPERGFHMKGVALMRKVSLLIVLFCICSILPKPVMAGSNEELLLETVGVLSAQGLYLTYTSIGSLADGHANKTYKKEFTVESLDKFVNLTKVAKEQLDKLLGSGAAKGADIEFINKLIATYDLLIAESNAYKNYCNTGAQEHLKIYDQKRNAAWKNIEELLGLK